MVKLSKRMVFVITRTPTKLFPHILASYSSNLRLLILLRFDYNTSFDPKEVFTSLSFRMVSFHFQELARSILVITFLPNDKRQDLCSIWYVDLFKTRQSVAMACIVCRLGFRKLELPCNCTTIFCDVCLA